MALNSIYSAVGCLHGTELVAHHVELELENYDVVSRPQQEYVNTKNLEIFVDKLVRNELMLPWVPQFLKRKLFFNILQLLLTIMHIVLRASQLDILGHRISIAFSQAPIIPRNQNRECSVDPECVQSYVDASLSDQSTNIWLLPDYIERPVLYAVHYMILSLLEEIFVDFRVHVLGDEVKFNLVRGVMPEVQSMSDGDVARYRAKLIAERAALIQRAEELKHMISISKMTEINQ